MIKVIFFDIGGVYSHGSLINFLNKACDILGIDRKIHSKEVVLDKALHKGKITEEECFRKYFGVPISEDDMKKIIELWTTNWKPRDDPTKITSSATRGADIIGADVGNRQSSFPDVTS